MNGSNTPITSHNSMFFLYWDIVGPNFLPTILVSMHVLCCILIVGYCWAKFSSYCTSPVALCWSMHFGSTHISYICLSPTKYVCWRFADHFSSWFCSCFCFFFIVNKFHDFFFLFFFPSIYFSFFSLFLLCTRILFFST